MILPLLLLFCYEYIEYNFLDIIIFKKLQNIKLTLNLYHD